MRTYSVLSGRSHETTSNSQAVAGGSAGDGGCSCPQAGGVQCDLGHPSTNRSLDQEIHLPTLQQAIVAGSSRQGSRHSPRWDTATVGSPLGPPLVQLHPSSHPILPRTPGQKSVTSLLAESGMAAAGVVCCHASMPGTPGPSKEPRSRSSFSTSPGPGAPTLPVVSVARECPGVAITTMRIMRADTKRALTPSWALHSC